MTIFSPKGVAFAKSLSFFWTVGLVFLVHIFAVCYLISLSKSAWHLIPAFSPALSLLVCSHTIIDNTPFWENFWPRVLGIGFFLDEQENNEMRNFKTYLPSKTLLLYERILKKRPRGFNSLDRYKIEKSWLVCDNFTESEKEAIQATPLARYLVIIAYPSKKEIIQRNSIFFEDGLLAQEIKTIREGGVLREAVSASKETSQKRQKRKM